MQVKIAASLSDAIIKKRHPRSDFRTAEAKRYTKRLRPFLKKVIFPSCKALDLGCSSGKFTFEMESLGAAAFGLDCSREAISYAQEIATGIGSKAVFQIGTFENIPYAPGSFDLVLFPSNIIECSYTEMERIIRQVYDLLADGGKFCIEMQDGLEKLAKQADREGPPDLLTGTRSHSLQIPGDSEYAYPTTFWTVAFAHFLISEYFNLLQIEKVNEKNYWMEYVKEPRVEQRTGARGDVTRQRGVIK